MSLVLAENLRKEYKIYRSPSHRIKELIFRRPYHHSKEVLRGVSLQVEQGESVGIVGENGSGKTTLLSLIAGVLHPSSGHVEVKGRVTSLLELGTGFHPEFTGRENVYVYASLIGFSREEIDAKLPEIREFADIGEYFDLPVKAYSTGMQMRLAFSVAMAFEPDIFIVDEALSVGDAYFQQRCFERVLGFRAKGGSLLIASHSTYHIVRLCDRAVWLHKGEIAAEGSPHKVVSKYEDYLREKSGMGEEGQQESVSEKALPPLFVKKVEAEPSVVRLGDPLEISIVIAAKEGMGGQVHAPFGVARNDGLQVFVTSTQLDGLSPLTVKGERRVVFKVPSLPLLAGEYYPVVTILDPNGLAPLHRMDGQPFQVEKGEVEMGVCFIEHEWVIE
jgi:ABC-type polysaccharide/polyol phosphate transport system ATPase subunit